MKKFNYPKYEQTIYQTTINGLKIVCIPNDNFKQTEVTLLVDYGATDIKFKNKKEVTSQLGAAHFIEHKIFELKDGSDAFSKLGALGANANAYTTYDETAYMFSASNNVYECFEVFLNFIFTNTFNDKSVNREKGIIIEELMMYLDKPNYLVQEELLRCLYKDNYIKDPILGTKDSINSFNKKNLSEIYEAFYHPENMVLNISGNINIEELETFLNKELNKYKFKQFNTEKIYPNESLEVNKSKSLLEINSDVNYFALGIKLEPVNTDLLKYDFITSAFNFMLFSKTTSKINELIESDLLLSQISYYTVINKYYSFTEFIAISDNQEELEKELKDMILNFEKNFKEEDFELFKIITQSQFIYSLENLDDLCYDVTIGIKENYDYFEHNEILSKITKEDVINFANKIKENNISIVTTKKIINK